MYRTVQIKCMKCGNSTMSGMDEMDEKYFPEQYYFCDCQNPELKIIEIEDIQDVDSILTWAESELENANFHSETSLPGSIYYELSVFIPEEYWLKMAKAIAKVFVNNI
jgi:hypothetical protein